MFTRRLRPVSAVFGFDRGKPIDRYYIEQFLERNRHDIRGSALEVKDTMYIQRFGSDITQADAIDINQSNAAATIHDDLTVGAKIPSNHYDCLIITQTFLFIANVHEAIQTCHRILKPGGVLLATDPVVSRIMPDVDEMPDTTQYENSESDAWRFTPNQYKAFFGAVFGKENCTISGYGNVFVCSASLYGYATEELTPDELDAYDPSFPVLLSVRAVKR